MGRAKICGNKATVIYRLEPFDTTVAVVLGFALPRASARAPALHPPPAPAPVLAPSPTPVPVLAPTFARAPALAPALALTLAFVTVRALAPDLALGPASLAPTSLAAAAHEQQFLVSARRSAVMVSQAPGSL